MKIHPFSTFAIVVLLFAFLGISAAAQNCPDSPGCLDELFGNAGKTAVADDYSAFPTNILLQSDGKIVTMPEGSTGYGHRIMRLNADGAPDASFGTGGVASFHWVNGDSFDIAIQNVNGSERFLVVGNGSLTVGRKTYSNQLRIDRLMPDGSMDITWGDNGVKMIRTNAAYSVTVQPDQKILLATGIYGTLVRLLPDGTLDGSFGVGGIVNSGDAREVRIDPVGRILVAGRYQSSKANNAKKYISIKRYFSDGTLDTSFGTNGMALTSPIFVNPFSFELDAEGRAIFGTSAQNDLVVQRFDTFGFLDASFGGGDGTVTIDFFGFADNFTRVTTSSDGRILVAGSVDLSSSGSTGDFGIARLEADGSLDGTFGTGGKVNYDITGDDYVGSVIVQMDTACACEKLVVAGSGPSATGTVRTFARLLLTEMLPLN